MDMIRGDQIAAEGLTDWRKLAQGLHARYRVEGFGEAARFVSAVGGILLALAGTLPVSPYITTISFAIYLVCRLIGNRRGAVTRAR